MFLYVVTRDTCLNTSLNWSIKSYWLYVIFQITWLQSNLKDWGKITFIFCSALQLFNETIYSLILFIYHTGRFPMSQYAYILVVLSLVFLFLLNKYEKERLQRLYQEQLLKDETFRSDIKEKIHTTENINDVIAHINKTYHLGMLLSKDVTDQLK